MRRRELLFLGAGTAVSWPLAARAQQSPKIARVGFLTPSAPDAPVTREVFDAIREELVKLGYVEGRNIVFEQRGSNGSPEHLAALGAELASLKVDVIIAIATPAARAAQHATNTIPIVVGSVGDPVADGFVASLSHPGGNITGTTFLGPELVPKRLGLLKELMPALSRVAALWDPNAFSQQTTTGMVNQAAEAAKNLDLQLRYVEVPGLNAFERAFADAAMEHVDALLLFPNPTFYENRKRLVDLAAQNRLPAMYNAKEFVEGGGLIAYGASLMDLDRRTAIYVDKILNGAKPADLPVELPTTFELAINRKTAGTLGIAIPQALAVEADEVID